MRSRPNSTPSSRNLNAQKNKSVNQDDLANPPKPGRRTDLLYNKENDVRGVKNKKDGNAAEYALRRLRKDRPDIHARVLTGEITANAGMIKLGFRKKRPSKKQTILQKIIKLLPQLSADDRDQLLAILSERRDAA